MRQRSLYKYYSERKWGEKFIDGDMRFRSLAYFRDYEDGNVRGDPYEGTSVYKPNGGLIINNLTQDTTFTMPYSFESSAKLEEIFVFCLSMSFRKKLWDSFGAVVCVEITDIPAFCARVMAALPNTAKYVRGGHRIGGKVTYYEESETCTPRWALPDEIATSKLREFAWQDEYRLVFCLTDALSFENVSTQLVRTGVTKKPETREYVSYDLKTASLKDISRLHESV